MKIREEKSQIKNLEKQNQKKSNASTRKYAIKCKDK
jgi:hypothetical protein